MVKHSTAHLFSNIMELAPDLSLPVFRYLDWNSKRTATVLSTSPNLEQNVDQLLAGDTDVVLSFSTHQLIRFDELSADGIRDVFRQISEASMFTNNFRPSHQQVIRTLEICGRFPLFIFGYSSQTLRMDLMITLWVKESLTVFQKN